MGTDSILVNLLIMQHPVSPLLPFENLINIDACCHCCKPASHVSQYDTALLASICSYACSCMASYVYVYVYYRYIPYMYVARYRYTVIIYTMIIANSIVKLDKME